MKQPPLQLEYAGARTPDTPMISYVDVLLANRVLIIALTLLGTIIGAMYFFLTPPTYESDISVQVEEDKPTAAKSILGDVSSIFDVKQATSGEMEILRSRLVIGHAVDTHKLYSLTLPDYFPVIGRWLAEHRNSFSLPEGLVNIIPGGYAWGGEKIHIDQIVVPDSLLGKKLRIVNLGEGQYELVDKVHNVRFRGQVGQLERFEVPGGSIDIQINTLQGRVGTRFTLIRESRLKTIQSLQSHIGISERGRQSGVIGITLQGQDPVLVAAVLNEIGQEYVRQNTNRKTAEAEKSLVFLDQQLPVLKQQLEDSEIRYNALRHARGTIDLSEEAKLVLGQSVETQNRLLELETRRQDLITRFAPSHPSIKTIDRQVASLNKDMSKLNKKIKGLPELEQDIVRLTRDVKVNTELYTALLNNAQQLRIVRAGKVGSVRVVDTAVPGEKPLSPKAFIILSMSTLAGFGLSIIIALLRNALLGGLTDPDEIERYTGLPVLATVPYSELQDRLWRRSQRQGARVPALLAQSNGSTPSIESLRSFRTVLQVAMRDSENKVVVFTGPIAGVGKSFLSANFAFIQAAVGKRVLLIDADFHRGTLNKYFSMPAENGLFEMLSGAIPLEAVTKRNIMNGVDFISTGKVIFDPSELLASKAFDECLKALSVDYDVVIVDTAPVLSSSDAAVVGVHAAAVMVVVRSGMNTVGEIRETAKRLAQVGAPVAGVVFNGLKLKPEGMSYRSKYGPYRYERASYYSESSV